MVSALRCASDQERVPLQVELVGAVEAGKLKLDDPVLAKVGVKWQGPQCMLRQGAIVKGRIVAQTVHSKTEKTSSIALLFESGECNGPDMKPLPMTVAAVLAADPSRDPSNYVNQPLSEAAGLGIGNDNGRSGGPASSGGRSVMTAAATVYASPPRYRGPTTVLPGQVVGIRGLKLSVGSGPAGSSVLSTSGHNVHIESGAQLLLTPNLNATAAVAPSVPASPAAAATVPSPAATVAEEIATTDETEVCSPPQCSIALASNEAEAHSATAVSTLSVKDLGYARVRPDHAMYRFNYGSAISYLGAKKLLFTFNPHTLVLRTGREAEFAKLHIIRAVLIDVEDKKVEKTVDWKVPDANQYLWSIGRDRVLVHVGRELRLYGPGLRLEQHLSLSGPLAFVRTSPSAKYFAVGVVQERHSNAVHRQLVDAEEQEPEEDIEVRVLDVSFHPLATAVRSSRASPPVLSDNGEIQVVSAGKSRWRIVEQSWGTQSQVLAAVNSGCRPETTSLSPDFLFIVGCERQNTDKWYRVLRPNGKPVLKGSSSKAELEQRASGLATGNAFAIGLAKAAKSIAAESAFSASDLESERISVYRSDNGERMLAISVPSPVTAVQSFVLSPDGNQLAVLSGEQIAFYDVPAAGPRR
ncbi:MAG: hypothetical protein ABSD75_03245 [Terriglobales bacterium]|jgi:hypothetical protein